MKNNAKIFLMNKYGRSDTLGFKYILYILENYKFQTRMCEVYQEIANNNNTTYIRVERAIRHFKGLLGIKLTNGQFVNNLLIEFEEYNKGE